MKRVLLFSLLVVGLLSSGLVPRLAHGDTPPTPSITITNLAAQAQPDGSLLYRVCVTSTQTPVSGRIIVQDGNGDDVLINLAQNGYDCGAPGSYLLVGSRSFSPTGHEVDYTLQEVCVANPGTAQCLSRYQQLMGTSSKLLFQDCSIDFAVNASGKVFYPSQLMGCDDGSGSLTGGQPLPATATPTAAPAGCGATGDATPTMTAGAAQTAAGASPTVTATSIPPTATSTSVPPTATSTARPTATSTARPTATPTNTDTPTRTPLVRATITPKIGPFRADRPSDAKGLGAAMPLEDNTASATDTVTSTPDALCTATSVPTTATITATATGTDTPAATATLTPSGSASTPTSTASATATDTAVIPTMTSRPVSTPTSNPPTATATNTTGVGAPTATATGTALPPTATATQGVISVILPPGGVVVVTPRPTSTGIATLLGLFRGTPTPLARTRTQASEPKLSVSVSPWMLRPGDTFAVTVHYIKWSLVRMAFGYAPHHQLTVTRRADSKGALTLHMRVPTVALHNGHGTATLSVVATSGTRKATTAVGLTLDTMILSPSGARIRGCAQAFTIRVAYASKARVQLVARYPNSHAFFTTWLTTDRHGMATGHFAVSYLSVKARRLTVLVAANGQSGHNRQTEQARITQLVPSACRGV